VNLEPADQFEPIAFIAIHEKVLLRRAKDFEPTNKAIGPPRPEYHLLDPATGETRLVSGEFVPLLQEGKRFLQPSKRVLGRDS